MKLVRALLSHVWLAIQLKHDGSGMPTRIPAASALMMTYMLLIILGKQAQSALTLELVLGLAFIAQVYVVNLRNKVVGLIILIGIIANALSLIASAIFGMGEQSLLIISVMEYIMIFFAIINLIKSSIKLT